MTLQPMAVLLVGGLLGARLGASSMILYLAMGAAGLPVFTPTVLLVGVARLIGPTGGYLLAYPVAAWAVGWFSDPGRQPGENQHSGSTLDNPGRQPGENQHSGSTLGNPGRQPGENQHSGSTLGNPGRWPGENQHSGSTLGNPGRQPGENQHSGSTLGNPGRRPGENQHSGSTLDTPGLAPGVRTPWLMVTIGVVVGLVLIHLGGLAQLAILTGDISSAARFGTLPFLLGDLIKIAVLVPVLTKLVPTIRARL
jgi:biotin transporter BioY